MGHIKPSFPTPAGGMDFGRIEDMARAYGPECIYLIGAGLFRRGPDLVESCRSLRRLVEEAFVEHREG